MNASSAPKAVIVGAGPVGCLSAIALANLGWHVTVYERRSGTLPLPVCEPSAMTFFLSITDMRGGSHQPLSSNIQANPRQRSINLTLSARGITALQAVDSTLVERILHNAVALRGRMVHHLEGNTTRQQYDRRGHCLYSIERGLLNIILLEAAASVPDITIHFLHKAQSVDFDNNTLRLVNSVSGQEFDDHFDLCIGADGSHSVIRHRLMVATQMEYSQHYLSHEYVEIKLPPGVDTSGHSAFLLDSDHLHVWPRGGFTLVAMPNKNKSFTCALFAPKDVFDNLQSPDTLVPFFKTHFPDLLSVLGEKQLVLELQRNPRSQMITTKANPYHLGAVIIIGDAAHSMVPFYGQGLNCALEDVRILSILLRREEGRDPSVIRQVLNHYSECRHEDLIAICDLAMDSHLNMRHSVATWSYMIRAFIDNALYAISDSPVITDFTEMISGSKVPSGWIPLYSMVSFRPDISYSAAKKKAERQARLVESFGVAVSILGFGYIFNFFINLNKLF
ncbi:FAD/NAD(P)-binding domain-containing protein [Mycena sanguinolenta]|uniref:Kynurenine 3-monooxygenase n=1 Tax=Mycena sanguinolenta TaxID=230812 RepID=A0A8H6XBL3_9AGAR|nr:FAD/NAD(P)-binding domain-containing protein [Mycena sanguinolenta]